MGGFGSGRHGGTVTAEGTASYIIAISSLRSPLRKAECLTGAISFNEGQFPVVITVDSSKTWDTFVELRYRENNAGVAIVGHQRQQGVGHRHVAEVDGLQPELPLFQVEVKISRGQRNYLY